jgi:hypothetical protein
MDKGRAIKLKEQLRGGEVLEEAATCEGRAMGLGHGLGYNA